MLIGDTMQAHNTTSNITDNDIGKSGTISWALALVVLTGVPAVGLGLTATVFLIEDLKKSATVVKKLILFLIVSDLIGVLSIFTKITHLMTNTDHINIALCIFVNSFIIYSVLLSSAIATTMSIERCLALRAPYWYARNMMGNMIWIPVGIAVVSLFVVCFIPSMTADGYFKKRFKDGEEFSVCKIFSDGQATSLESVAFPLTFATVLTLIVIVNLSCNVLVMYTMRNMRRVIPWYNEIQGQTEEFMMTKMLMSLSVTFLVCFTPFVVELVLTETGVVSPLWFKISTQAILSWNYIADPCVYLFVHKKYRRRFRTLCCQKTEQLHK